MSMRGPRRVGALAVAGILALAGCSTSVSGTGQAAGSPSGSSSSATSAPSSSAPTSTGPTSTVPSNPSSTGPTRTSPTASPLPALPPGAVSIPPTAIAQYESHRIGAALVVPSRVWPGAAPVCNPSGPYPTPASTGIVFDNKAGLLSKAGYAGGYYACFTAGGSRQYTMVVGLLEFPDARRAHAAAAGLALGSDYRRVSIPTMPRVFAGINTSASGTNEQYLQAAMSFGPLVAYDFVQQPGAHSSSAPIVGLVQKSVKEQVAYAAHFTPTPQSQWGKVNDDPHNLEDKVVQPTGNPDFMPGGYDLASYAAVGFSRKELTALKKAGFSEYYLKDGLSGSGYIQVGLYQLSNPANAERTWFLTANRLQAQLLRSKAVPAKFTPQPKKTFCLVGKLVSGTISQQCLVAVKNFVVEVATQGYAKSPTDLGNITKVMNQQLKLTPP